MIKFLKRLKKDFNCIFERDPSVQGISGFFEVLLSYPGLHALVSHRFCHGLYKMGIPVLPRLLSQFTRFITGIEIHPGAQIGEGFFIDHGMGVVIGQTTIIGNNVTLYQGVTLGGTGKEHGKRHPTLGSNIVVGAGAKVLGNITIGDNSMIGAGSVVVHNVPPDSTVVGVPGQVVRRKVSTLPELELNHTDLPDPLIEQIAYLQAQLKEVDRHLSRHILDVKEREISAHQGKKP